MPKSVWEIQFFDPKSDYNVCWKRLPHWSQAGTAVFITWRTKDSMPAPVLRRFERERNAFLEQQGIDPASDWKTALSKLPVEHRRRAQLSLFECWDDKLDACHGACVLREPKLSNIVAESLLKFDGDRYWITDFIVMPNHVHLLAAFRSEDEMLEQCRGWKRFTGRQINLALGKKEEFWQVEAFDHLVRSPEAFDHYRRYIAQNPVKARLPRRAFRHFTKDLGADEVESRRDSTS